MVHCALLVRFEAKPGKEIEVEKFLREGLALVEEEPDTTAWFALRLNSHEFGIFDAFPDEAGRKAHLAGKVAETLFAKSPDLFAREPSVEQIDINADKLPGSGRAARDLPPEAYAP